MKQAKISITADTKGFKSQIETAKKQVEGLFRVKMSPEAANHFKKVLGEQLTGQIKGATKELAILQKRMEQIGKGSIVDPRKLDAYIRRVNDLTLSLDKAKKAQSNLGGVGKGSSTGVTPEVGEGGVGGTLGKLSGIAKAAGLALGAMYIYQRRLTMAQERTSIRETGSALGSEKSSLGFTPAERRSRELDTSRAAGRRLSSDDMTRLTDVGEEAQRGYGISQGESTGAMMSARKAGQGDGDKYLASTIGAATAAGLEGSRIGEFLSSSASALEEMNKNGIGIDTASLNGFAAALSTMPFFKSDPSKAFEQIKGIAGAFSGGDRFQQAQAARAIQGAYQDQGGKGTLDPASVEIRRQNLFMDATKEQKDKMSPELRKVFDIKPETIVKQLIAGAIEQTKGMGKANQIMEVQTRLGLKGESGSALADQLLMGGKIDMKKIRDAQDPDKARVKMKERAAETMSDSNGKMLNVNANLEQSKDIAVDGLTDSIVELTDSIIKLTEKMGGQGAASSIGGTAIGIGTAAVAMALLPKGLKGLLSKGVGGAMSLGAAGLEGIGAAGLGTLAGAGAAGGAGYLAGTYAANPLLDKFTTKENRYGQKSNAAERGIGGLMNMLPSWAGGISNEDYESMYGTKGTTDPLLDKGTGATGSRSQTGASITPSLDGNTSATTNNTDAIMLLTEALSSLIGRSSGPQIPLGMKAGRG